MLPSLCPKILSLLPLSIACIIDNNLVRDYLYLLNHHHHREDDDNDNDNDDDDGNGDDNDNNGDDEKSFTNVMTERNGEARVCEDLLLKNNDMTIQSLETVIEVCLVEIM